MSTKALHSLLLRLLSSLCYTSSTASRSPCLAAARAQNGSCIINAIHYRSAASLPAGEGIFSFPHPCSVCSPLYQRNALYIIHPIGMVYHRGFALYIIKASPCIDLPLRYDRSTHEAVIFQNPPQSGQFVNCPYKRYSTHEVITFHNPTLEALHCLL